MQRLAPQTGAHKPGTLTASCRLMAVLDDDRETVELRELATGNAIGKFTIKGNTNCLAFSPDGRTLAVGTLGGEVVLWDVAQGARSPPCPDTAAASSRSIIPLPATGW